MLGATVNTDASYCGHTDAGGWAVWIAIDGGRKIRRSGKFKEDPKHASDAELKAMLIGAWIAASEGAVRILVQGDCQGALQLLKRRDGSVPEVLELYKRFPDIKPLRTKWVKGHKLSQNKSSPRHWVNDWCDKAAKQHMLEIRAQRNKRYQEGVERDRAYMRKVQSGR